MKLPYYPGCTLKKNAKNFEISAMAAAKHLGIELIELPRWNCCGAVSSLTSDDVMHHVAAIRNLVRVQQMNDDGILENEYRLIVLCSMCFNVLKRSNMLVTSNASMLNTINSFMDTEPDYEGTVEVKHFLEILRDEIGFERLKNAVRNPLKGLKISPYYGCTLLRPKEIGIDDAESPSIMENLIEALGGDVADNPYKSLCCGSYHTVGNAEVVAQRTYKIIEGARRNGADVIITSCPLCAFNLDNRQALTEKLYPGFKRMPILYFTQLMALAFGYEKEAGFDGNFINPIPLLEEKGLIGMKVQK
ncbi:MAG: heterodisulfide reductase, subunit B [Thermoplasmata archaeon]|nr:MAG: heterodisulfide reductase, subunit B [Thermoplasmata archaeon]MCD6573477.1 CoB--CoM heterodisulfide reductase iron-sulfur subunit B family protein [Thermoplasmata archaeon]